MEKTIHDIFRLGSGIVINGQQNNLDKIMIWGTPKLLYTVLEFLDKNGSCVVYGVDIETNHFFELSFAQSILYDKNLQAHKSRFNEESKQFLRYKEERVADDYNDIIEKIFSQHNIKNVPSIFFLRGERFAIEWYSFLCSVQGDTLIVSVTDKEMKDHLSTQALYYDVDLTISFPTYDLKYRGSIVRIERTNSGYLLHIQPYPIEVMQSTQLKNTVFENINNPFTVMDFIVNHADSDVKGIVYPNSDNKHIYEYIVVGILKNIKINIEDCVLGAVRIGKPIEVSKQFENACSDFLSENMTIIWVNVKSDSLYNAFLAGKKLLIVAADFLTLMIKNDMYADWFGVAGEVSGKVWDVRSHYPKISICSVFYIENCILGESITLLDERVRIPSTIIMDEDAEYLFDYDWIEKFFIELYNKNQKIFRLQYALKWIVQAWNTEDVYDRVIYCSMALEFIVNGEKGNNIFNEYAIKVGRSKFTKLERKKLVNNIVEKLEFENIEGFSQSDMGAFNTSIKKMVQSKLSEVSFFSKLDMLIDRLNIPVSAEEKELLSEARTIRNELIHGLNMASISTMEIKRLCGVTSRILMYKLINELNEEA